MIRAFLGKWGIFMGIGAAIFVGTYLLVGRKKAATTTTANANPSGVAVDAAGNPLVEYVPTTGDAYTSIAYNSNNAAQGNTTTNNTSNGPTDSPITNSNNSSSNSNNNTVPPPPAPPVWHKPPDEGDAGGHDQPVPDPDPGDHHPPIPVPVPHPAPAPAPPPPAKPPVTPKLPPQPVETNAAKAIADWQTANKKKWTGPSGSFPFGWGPAPHSAGAGVVNNGVFSYVVKP